MIAKCVVTYYTNTVEYAIIRPALAKAASQALAVQPRQWAQQPIYYTILYYTILYYNTTALWRRWRWASSSLLSWWRWASPSPLRGWMWTYTSLLGGCRLALISHLRRWGIPISFKRMKVGIPHLFQDSGGPSLLRRRWWASTYLWRGWGWASQYYKIP